MSISTNIYRDILKEYEGIRDESQKLLKQKQADIYRKIPSVENIDRQLSLIGVKLTKAIIENPSNSQKLLADLETENKKLLEQKSKLLEQSGFRLEDLTINYICSACKDTGYINNKMCKCMKQKLINRAYMQSNLKDIVKAENFRHFNLDYYSDSIDFKEQISPKENMSKVFATCKNFIKRFNSEFENLILYGKPGRGKTFLCNCIAKEILDRGKTVLYLTAFQLFKMVEEEKFNKNADEHINQYLDTVLDVDLLIIDDLGTEVSTVVTNSEFYNIVNLRLINKKSTIISTNLSPSELMSVYSDRVISRIQGNYTTLKIFGDDIRLKKKYNT